MKSRKRLLLPIVLLCVLLAQKTQAREAKVFLLLATDTSKDGGISLSTGPDWGFMFDAFYANVPERQLVVYGMDSPALDPDAGERTAKTVWTGPDIRYDLGDMRKKLLEAIDKCPAGPNDTIVFFYSGHGAHDSQGHFLRMPDQKTDLYRKDIIRRIQRKNPRLAVVITDSCNELMERALAPRPIAPKLLSPKEMSPLFDELFIRSKGLADINSSSSEEEQVAAGPVGGGLLVLAMAYMGNKPDFSEDKAYRAAIRGITIEPSGAPGVSIPPVPFDQIIAEHFGWREHGMHANFNPNLPAYGFLWTNREQRASWESFRSTVTSKVDNLFRTLCPRGTRVRDRVQRTQTPQFYRLPTRIPGPRPPANGNRQEPSLKRGDIILCVNGQSIGDCDDYWDVVKKSPTTMKFSISRAGQIIHLQTILRPGNGSRFGVAASDDNGIDVRVVDVEQGSPGSRATVDDNGTAIITLRPGDVIFSINGGAIADTNDYWHAIKKSPGRMQFSIKRGNRVYHLNATLLRGNGTRFGVNASDMRGAGVRVLNVRKDFPGNSAELLRID